MLATTSTILEKQLGNFKVRASDIDDDGKLRSGVPWYGACVAAAPDSK